MAKESKYDKRGVSATKDEVHAAIKDLDKGLYPKAFCKILPDLVAGSPDHCNIMHADTAGTKTSLAYLYWRETGDLSVWKGVAQDAIVMNLDDMACVGCLNDIVLSSTIGRNKNLISGDVISTIINAAVEFCDNMRDYGVGIGLAGGETADVGDIVRTIDVGYTTFARMPKKDLIVNDIKEGNVIVGLASFGQAIYESEYNGGMGSNGLTSARHDVFSFDYANKYPESFDPAVPKEYVYAGSKKLTDNIEINGASIPVGKLVLSPTRTYMPVLKKILNLNSNKNEISGIIHCTGGGQTKVLHFVDNVHVIKDNLFEMPPLFKLIKEESGTDLQEMYKVFNMGHRLEFYTTESFAKEIMGVASEFGIESRIIGRVEASGSSKLTISVPGASFGY